MAIQVKKIIVIIFSCLIMQSLSALFDDKALEEALHAQTTKFHRKSRKLDRDLTTSVKDLFWGLAEVAMYRADRFFGFHMVPLYH